MKYICYYDLKNNNENRRYILSATNKIDYILRVIRDITDEEIDVISASTTLSNKYYRGRSERLDKQTRLKLFPTFGRKNIVSKLLDKLIQFWGLLFYLLKSIDKNEVVIVYHSFTFINVMRILKRLKKFNLVLELEEIYSDVSNDDKRRKAEEAIFSIADAYIFPTQLLDEKVNILHKPSVIIHGTYQVEYDRNVDVFNNENKVDLKIVHCVYAGTLDPRKGGATAALAALYLPANYHIHILGFGSDSDKDEIKKLITEINAKSSAVVTYDGLLSGEEYIRFLQSCCIGLSTQNPNATFNATSFPSKILSYLSNGLHVVSIRIPAIEKSAVAGLLSFYDKQTPEEIAEAIMKINLSQKYDSRKKISELSDEFTYSLINLIETLRRRSI